MQKKVILKKIKVENTVGLKLAHDHTQILPGEFKGVGFRRGHLVRKSDLPKFLDLGKTVILGALVKGSSLRLTHILPFCKEGLCPDR